MGAGKIAERTRSLNVESLRCLSWPGLLLFLSQWTPNPLALMEAQVSCHLTGLCTRTPLPLERAPTFPSPPASGPSLHSHGRSRPARLGRPLLLFSLTFCSLPAQAFPQSISMDLFVCLCTDIFILMIMSPIVFPFLDIGDTAFRSYSALRSNRTPGIS